MSAVVTLVERCSLPAAEFRAATASVSSDVYSALRWRFIGPEGNRISAVAGVPGDPLVYYAGSASGGIFKTIDGGVHWEPIFDDQAVSSIGALAVAPSDPNVVWAGTGEAWIRSHISIGEGIYKSTDAGKTWTRMGLEKTGRIGRVVVDPGRTPTSCSRARWAPRTARSPSAVCSAPPTAARTGRARCSWTRTPAARTSGWIRRTRAFFSRACGRSRSTPGGVRAAGRAAACSRRGTAA